MKRNQYKIKYDVTLKNRLNNEIVRGNMVNEKDIDGKQYWIRNNKKELKYRLIRLIDEEFPNIDISVIHRTVKMFLDMVNLIDED